MLQNEQTVVQSKQQYENDNFRFVGRCHECKQTNHLTYTRSIYEKRGKQKYQKEGKVGQDAITTTKLLTEFAILKD
jgi:hypothetical protein